MVCMNDQVDVLVIGGGPAGLAAAIAARRGDLDTAATLVAGGARCADSKGMGHHADIILLRAEVEAALDASGSDLSAALDRGQGMTIEDLVNEVLRVVEGA